MNLPTRIFSTARGRTRTLVLLAVIGAGFLLGTILIERHISMLLDPAALREFVAGFGYLAPLAFVLLQTTQVVLAPIPGQVLGLASGYLFGAVAGTVYSLLGATLGSTIVFVLARRFGRPYVEEVIDLETLRRFDEFVNARGVFAVFVVFLLPGLPDDAVCFLAGVTRIPVWKLVVVSLIGRVPGYFLVNLAGARFAAARPLETTVILLGLAVAAILVYWKRDAILCRLTPPE